MSDFLDKISKLSPQRLALLADELNERIQAAEKQRRVPLAVIGMGCRFPGGVHDPEEFWELLSDGVDAISEVPLSRWDTQEFYDRNPATPGKMATRWGGFIEAPEQFDAKFFGIAPTEAMSMDPQQRLLLETSWEALEHAGIAPSRLAGTKTGVFVGICNGDYSQVALNSPREKISPYFAPGLSHAVAAGRISYVLGFQGPSMAVDTSCSASLVAAHLACQSLRLGECNAALAGGVNLILNPDITIALSQSRMMAPDGRCKAFSESANGFVRGEGCGMILLKRLPDAIRDRNRILAVIRGSACNQDGRSSGLTVPNGPSQEAVVAAALADAGMHPNDVDYIEAHGTGTSLGDPIEAGALNAVFTDRSRNSEPLLVGSVKTNLGHLESAAGIAGLMKLVLSIQHEEIPASLHFDTPNNRIEWDHLPIRVPTELQAWNRRGRTRVGGVSSFGFSGTNAHVIVEEYLQATEARVPSILEAVPAAKRAYLFPLSAKTETALRSVAAGLHRHLLAQPSLSLADIARTLHEGRSHLEYRAALVAASHAELLEQLHGLANQTSAATVRSGRVVSHSPRIAFIFGGDESTLPDEGQSLYTQSAAFREAVQRCDEIVRSELGLPLHSPLYCESASPSANQPASQPQWYAGAAAFARQYALSELWRSCGIEPSAVLGYGSGEIVAAAVTGVLSLHDGLRLAIANAGNSATKLDECANQIRYGTPQIPLLSNLIRPGRHETPMSSADYWRYGSQSAVPSREALALLAKENCAACLYMGDASALQQFAQSAGDDLPGTCLASFDRGRGDQFLRTGAALYVLGCRLDMDEFSSTAAANTISLPTYPFERERYWLDPEQNVQSERNAGKETLHQDKFVRSTSDAPFNAVADPPAVDGDDWIYDLVWTPKPLPHKASRSTIRLDTDLMGSVAVTPASEELLRVERLMAALKPVYVAYILRALQDAGLSPLPTAAFNLEDLSQRLKIIPARRRVLARMLAILAEDGIAERTADRFRIVDFSPRPDADLALDKLSVEYPEMLTEINILKRCGKKLLPVLRGDYDPMQLVFADGSIGEAEKIYEQSPVCRFFNDKAAKVVRSAVDSITERPARILEIGGGTGATTVPILSALADKDIEYVFTDVSPVFLSRARVKFSNTPTMSYRTLDIENDPVEQGFEAGSYDIIIAANVLHATADLRRTLAHIRTMLAPGGVLLLVEGIRPDRWLDLTFGLTDGWWRFSDLDLRQEHPLVSAESWARLLNDAGIGFCRNISYVLEDGSLSQQVVIVAHDDADDTLATGDLETPSRHWMIFADEFGVGDALHKLLGAKGELCETIRRPGSAREIASELLRLKTASRANASREIVYLWGMDAADSIGSSTELAQGEEVCAKTLVHLIQTLLTPSDRNAHLWIATRGAQATDSFSPAIGGVLQSLAWGVGRVLGMEAPEQYRGLIDVDVALTPEAAATNLLAELLDADQEDQVAYRHGERLVARLKQASLKSPTTQAKNGICGDASYLIVGGLGGVGLQVARWTAERGPGHLVLLSRTGIGSDAGPVAAERLKTIREIEALGVNVTVVAGDVASTADMERLFDRFGREFPPLRGVFHAAMVVSGATLSDLTEETIDRMFRPKVLGTWVLHQQTKNLDLDFFLAFSSTTSLLGAKGLAHYAAANQFQDSFAHYRRSLGLPMLSINWGAWDTMWSVSSRDQERSAEAGLLPMPSEKVFNMFGNLIDSSRAQVMIANMDWNVLKPVLESQRTRPLLEQLGNVHGMQTQIRVASVPNAASLHRVMDLTPENRRQSIEAFVQEQAARVLGFRSDEVLPVEVPLTDLGLDSLMAVDLKNRLQAGLGQDLSPTVVFDYPSVSEMVGLLETMLWAAHGSLESESATLHKEEIRI
jgi:acyl transferase domain-containing protein/predicted O-methyltransferase YrrM